MTLEQLGNAGEFLGSVFVLVTLVYIAIQTRQTRLVAAAEVAREFNSGYNAILFKVHNGDMAKVFRLGINDWHSLDGDDQLRLHTVFLGFLVHYQGVLQQEKIPGVKDQLLRFEEDVLAMLASPGGSAWWESIKALVDPDVVKRLDARLADAESMPPSWTAALPWMGAESRASGT